MNKLEAIEKAFIRFAAVNSSAAKQIQRWEFESWLDEALTRVGRNVTASQNFRTLQKRFTAQLGFYDKPISFDVGQSWSAADGWGSGVTINADGAIQGVIDSFILATEAVEMAVGQVVHKDQYFEFTWDSDVNQPVSFALVATTLPISALKPSPLIEQADILFGLTIEQQGGLAAFAAGNPVLNPDVTLPISLGDRVRIYFDATNGQIKIQHYQATASVLYAEYPLVTYADATIPLTLNQAVIPLLLFHDSDVTNARVKNVRVGVIDACLAAIESRVIMDSIRTRGSVRFEDGKPLAYVADSSLSGLPRIRNQWHWTDENRQMRVFPSPQSERVYSSPLDVPIYRYDAARNAWVSLAALPSGVSLAAGTITASYDPSEVQLAAGISYAVNTTKEGITLRLPANAANGALVKLQDAGTSWETNPVTLRASYGDVLLEVAQTRRRIVYEANTIPTIEEVPFELGETLINALLEIGLERKGQPALKQKANQIPATIPNTQAETQTQT